VAGFVGFEPRIRDGGSCLIGTPPAGHRFVVDVTGFHVRIPPTVRSAPAADDPRLTVPANPGLVLSSASNSIPIAVGGSVVYSLVAIAKGQQADMRVVSGPPSTDQYAQPVSDAVIAEQSSGPWVRVADAAIRLVGAEIRTSIIPRLAPVRCDDWEEYQYWHGVFDERDASFLARAVRAYFSNGGTRCHVATIRRVDPEDADSVLEAATDLMGLPGSSATEATGFERLLLIEEVAVIDLPDLYARRQLAGPVLQLPPPDTGACFRPCGPGPTAAVAAGPSQPGAPVFDDDQILEIQRALMVRAAAERWRVMLLLATPVEFDTERGDWASPSHRRASGWRSALAGATDDAGSAATALYHPWLLAADREGGPLIELPPGGFTAGVIARRDLSRGPLVAPANEPILGAVALARPLNDRDQAALYGSPNHIDVVRAFTGLGLFLWGARTLSTDQWLQFVNVRRGLSAIERRMVSALRPLVFEPNTPALWFHVTQVALGVLLEQFQRGTLQGSTPEEAFYVRCDESDNPPQQVENGIMLCEVGVAIAAPAEFVVFRVGQSDELLSVVEP
jgi:hypothetical protein